MRQDDDDYCVTKILISVSQLSLRYRGNSEWDNEGVVWLSWLLCVAAVVPWTVIAFILTALSLNQ